MTGPRPLPDALLERYLAGDLTGEARARVEQALEASASERARLEALRADSAAFLISHPPGPLAARLESEAKPRWRLWLPLVGLAAAAGLVVLLRPPPEPEGTVKGGLVLSAFRQREGAEAEALGPGAKVKPGDKLRFSVAAPGDGFLAVLSLDGAGQVSVYHPFSGTSAAAYRAASPLLPEAIALDEVKGRERVWAVFGKEAFALEPLLSQLREGRAPSGAGLATASLEWVKE